MAGVRRRIVLAGSLGTTFAVTRSVEAQADWPRGPIKFIVPFPPGGGTDPIARFIAAKVGDTTGWQIVVENKPGAAGVIGAAVVAKAPADGQTWLVTFDSHILSPAFSTNLPYKESELFNVMLVGRAPLVIVCHPDRPVPDFAEVVADARQRPGKVSIGMLSASQSLLLLTHVKNENGFEPNLIFYKGGGPIVQDALAGVTDTRRHDPGFGHALLPHRQAPAACHHRREAADGAAGHADARRAGHQVLPDLFMVGHLRARRHAGADPRAHERRARQGGALARRHAEARRAGLPRSARQLAAGVRVLPEGRAGAVVQDHQGEQHQDRLRRGKEEKNR